MLYALVGVLGLAIGSFLNVVIHRVPRGESLLRPASHCPQCTAPVRPWHNVPLLGWLLLRGRCADCAAPISVRYPLVELGTATLFVAVAARFGWSAALPAWLYLAAIAVALALIDLDVLRLPNAIVLPSYLVVPTLFLPAVILERDWSSGLRGLVGMAVLFTFYLLLSVVYPGGMGFGDVKLAGVLGLYLGWLGWAPLAVGTLAAFLLGGVTGIALMAGGRAGRKTALPFGPSMLAGALVALFAAAPIADWYTSILLPA
ncbi:prepilin peptidase [Dactylosporangium aurantiacum]|uniref:Prepilin leader peptidase/N-methyltransferase n=1 Tax=Dactylosporangium aurantiacum TaxID=35754 RepID=A0A9Q9IDQ2_9ACTN|nr:A24 family peptidase [Dactylosporangium aurantiacum]MDG6102235.1 prepilin peptidase [Dactylosporangium aurantiacum]UWZ53451.1 prepilin peptidase [Dactylosporangium aurantiacum]